MIDQSVRSLSENLRIVPRDHEIPVKNLSGGNQQKVVLAKALDVYPSILILDEPTRGIDVNAKHEIYQLIKKLASEGMSIIMISSEMPEILLLSDRIIVMCEGKITGLLSGKDATEEEIMVYAMGESNNVAFEF
jgi:methyl-galactoside transport system ATP-binding protein